MNKIKTAPALLLTLMLPAIEAQTRPNMVGSYGPWLADQVLGNNPGRLSFRAGKWKNVGQWQKAGRKRLLELVAPADLGGTPKVTTHSPHHLRWPRHRVSVMAVAHGSNHRSCLSQACGCQRSRCQPFSACMTMAA